MKLLDSSERLIILITISDQLWDDYMSGLIPETEYTLKIDEIRREIRNEVSSTFFDMQTIASNIGYVLARKPNALGLIKSYKIIKN